MIHLAVAEPNVRLARTSCLRVLSCTRGVVAMGFGGPVESLLKEVQSRVRAVLSLLGKKHNTSKSPETPRRPSGLYLHL